MLADDVGGDALLVRAAREQERERVPEELGELGHGGDCILAAMRLKPSPARFAERTLHGVDENGAEERIVVWIERRQGAVWAVGRAVNPQHRSSDEPRRDDYVFEGYELEDALEAANGALSRRLARSAQDGRPETCRRSSARRS